jgi:cell division transport system permease protein
LAVVLFLEKDISDEKIKAIQEKLNQSPLLSRAEFIPAEQALDKFRGKFPELSGIVDNLKSNPFPSSFEATLKQNLDSSQESSAFLNQIRLMPGIEDIQFNRDWVERMHSFSRLARAIGFFLGGILVLASFFIISNVIKLNVFARQDEIGILRLTGATNMFIRVPFLFEGIALGFIGGILSLLLLLVLVNLFPLYLGTSLGVLNELINFRYLSLEQSMAIIMAGAATGFLGSISSLARFLKI